MSIGELLNMYRDNELDIHPEFQRVFRWKDEQKSRLIESLLLGIPIPSIFVAQRKDGVWDVVDGLQRLSTIFQLVGVLKDDAGKTLPPLVLTGTRYLSALTDMSWENTTKPEMSFSQEERLIIKRSKIDVKIILRESDEQSKYELFQRLNTGGSPLSDQEVRSCVLIMVNKQFYGWVRELCKNSDFQDCISLSDRLHDEQYDMELVTRFLVLRTIEPADLGAIRDDLSTFLTDRIVALASQPKFDTEKEKRIFEQTFAKLNATVGDDAFRRYDSTKRKFLGPFLISAYEAVALGLSSNFNAWKASKYDEEIPLLIKKLWKLKNFLNGIGSGVSSASRLPVTIPVGRELFRRTKE